MENILRSQWDTASIYKKKKKGDRVSKSCVRCVAQTFMKVLRSEACVSHFSQIDIAAISHLFTLHLSLILKGPQTLRLNMATSQRNERMGNASALMMLLCVTCREWRHGGQSGCGPRHTTAFPLCHPISWALPAYDRQPERRKTRCPRCSVSEGGLLTKERCRSTFRHQDRMDGVCEFQVSHESFGFSHNSAEESGKEHDTSSLQAPDPDKHVYALGSFISEFNKGCFRSGWFQWEIQLDVPSIHILGCRDFIRYSISFFCKRCQGWSLPFGESPPLPLVCLNTRSKFNINSTWSANKSSVSLKIDEDML